MTFMTRIARKTFSIYYLVLFVGISSDDDPVQELCIINGTFRASRNCHATYVCISKQFQKLQRQEEDTVQTPMHQKHIWIINVITTPQCIAWDYFYIHCHNHIGLIMQERCKSKRCIRKSLVLFHLLVMKVNTMFCQH